MGLRLRDFGILFAVLAVSAACSCAEHAPPVETKPIAVPIPPDAGALPTVQLLIPLDGGLDAGSEGGDVATKKSVSASEWLDARGIPQAQRGKLDDAGSCEELNVGTSFEPALVCTVMEDVTRKTRKNTMDRMVGRRSVNVVRGNAIVEVLDVVVSIEALDKANATQPNILDLGLHLAPDGMTATLDEDTGARHITCSEAVTRAHMIMQSPDSLPYRDWPIFDNELIHKACASRGDWEWQKDRFVRAARKAVPK